MNYRNLKGSFSIFLMRHINNRHDFEEHSNKAKLNELNKIQKERGLVKDVPISTRINAPIMVENGDIMFIKGRSAILHKKSAKNIEEKLLENTKLTNDKNDLIKNTRLAIKTIDDRIVKNLTDINKLRGNFEI